MARRNRGESIMNGALQAVCIAGILIPCCVMDVKIKKLPTLWLLVWIMVGWLANGSFGAGALFFFMSVLPGTFLYMVSLLTKGGMGRGDALLYLAVGAVLGMGKTLTVLLFSLFLAAGYGVLQMKIRKRSGKYRIPFAPFTAGGYFLFMIARL